MSGLTKRLLAAVLLTFAASCAHSESDDAASGDQSEDELILRKGSVDQAGIVESTTMMLGGTPADSLLDAFNQEDPFAIRGTRYAQAFSGRLAQFDGIDGKTDWTADKAAAWASRMSAGNYLVVDLEKPCDFENPHTYLEIERSQMQGREHSTCGGRMPNEDALDVTLNWLVRGPDASALDDTALHDGVEQATHKSTDTFPYLADMNRL